MNTFYTIQNFKIIPKPSKDELYRIKSLRIPPAWTNVKINKDSTAKLQVVGQDSKLREQRIYHPNWVQEAAQEKFKHVSKLSRKISNFDKILNRYLRRFDLSYECVIANMIKIFMVLNIRIGSEICFEENGTCGICTLRKCNLKIKDNNYTLSFVGKKNVQHDKLITSTKIKHFLDKMKKIKNERLFCYNSDKEYIPITAQDINNFIKTNLGESYSSKDLRTYSANQIFKQALKNYPTPKNEKDIYRNIRNAVKTTAEELGNTPKVCKDSYIDPHIIDKYVKMFDF